MLKVSKSRHNRQTSAKTYWIPHTRFPTLDKNLSEHNIFTSSALCDGEGDGVRGGARGGKSRILDVGAVLGGGEEMEIATNTKMHLSNLTHLADGPSIGIVHDEDAADAKPGESRKTKKNIRINC